MKPIRRVTFAFARRMYGRTLQPTRVLAHHRTLLVGHSSGNAGLLAEKGKAAEDGNGEQHAHAPPAIPHVRIANHVERTSQRCEL